MRVPAIDVYATFRCNMRCRHCFVGEALNQPLDLPWDLLAGLLDTAAWRWGTREVAFLGGEPTLYPRLDEAVEYARRRDLDVRIVSNGGASLQRLLDSISPYVQIAVSLDGPTAEMHDLTRQPGSFQRAMDSINLARARGHPVSAILSVGRHNAASAVGTLAALASAGVEYVNVHYVTNRGFASADMVLDPSEWLRIREQVEACVERPRTRFEGTFHESSRALRCAVRDDSMLMLFPDARVFQCSMYFGLPHGHSFTWDGHRLTPNPAFVRYRPGADRLSHCPAIDFVNPGLRPAAEAVGRRVGGSGAYSTRTCFPRCPDKHRSRSTGDRSAPGPWPHLRRRRAPDDDRRPGGVLPSALCAGRLAACGQPDRA